MTNILLCPECGERNHITSRYCTRCGEALNDAAVILGEMDNVKRQPRPQQNDALDLPKFKSYPVLGTIAQMVKFIGWLTIVAGIILFFICVSYVAPGVRFLPKDMSSGNGLFFLIGIFILSPSYILIGSLMIAGGESIQLFIDLQENADRQSILLTLLYNKAKEKGKKE